MLDIQNYLKIEDVYYILEKYIVFRDHSHERKVLEYANKILTSLKSSFDFSPEEQSLLQYSALLHDIGYYIDKKGHHKHTRYIILNDAIFNCVPENLRSILALVSAGHRKSIGKGINNHSLNEQNIILRLASILRIADALDHTHKTDMVLNKIWISQEQLVLNLDGHDIFKIKERIMEKSDLFRENFNMEVLIEAV